MRIRYGTSAFGIVLLSVISCISTNAFSAEGERNRDFRVFAQNNLGMHCYDADFSVFSILPPFNVVRGQVVYRGFPKPMILDNRTVSLNYSATPDPTGSINTTSAGKTDFWDHIAKLFGVSRPVDTGILGAKMPGPGNPTRPMSIDTSNFPVKWFAASGIPITMLDDTLQANPYPLMRIGASEKWRGTPLSSLDIVVPVSSEMNCASCHETGMDAASSPAGSSDFHGVTDDKWSQNPDPTIRYRENILTLHDAMNGTALMASKPVLCASCHYSKALDLNGTGPGANQQNKLYLSHALHRHHGLPAGPGANTNAGVIPIPEPDAGPSVGTCYFCHPGSETQCLRSVMAVKGVMCQNCHGGLTTLGGVDAGGREVHTIKGTIRQPWVDLPKCQSCHTGDAVSHLGNTLVRTQAYADGDPAANPTIARNKRFAETDGKLYQTSSGHGGMTCQSCHGSTHAEWPAKTPGNDDIPAMQLQGHTGPIIECTTCHRWPLIPGLRGPHGLHPVNDRLWNKLHGVFWVKNKTSCKTCHGLDLKGTSLSRAATDRQLVAKGRASLAVSGGTPMACSLCHAGQFK